MKKCKCFEPKPEPEKKECCVVVNKAKVYNVTHPEFDNSRNCGGNVRIRNGN